MNIEIKSISQIVDEATAGPPEQPIEDRRALIAELRQIKNQLEAGLRALALVRLTNLLRRLDESPQEGPQ